MKKILTSAVFMFILAVASWAAAETLIVTTGDPSGSYGKNFVQMKEVCKQVDLTEWTDKGKVSYGSPMNIDNLDNNRAQVGYVQEDGLFAALMIYKDPEVSKLKVLFPLYDEEVHLIVLNESRYRYFTDLAHTNVGAWGGSIDTAKFLFAKADVQEKQVYDTTDRAKAFQWLDGKNIQAILAVGGQPLGWVETLPKKYRLIEFNAYDKVKKYYKPAVLTYPNLGQRGVKTVSTKAVLVTNDYKSQIKMENLKALRGCIIENLDVFAETTGYHPKWKKVREAFEEANGSPKSKWPLYTRIGSMKATNTAVPAPAKKGKKVAKGKKEVQDVQED